MATIVNKTSRGGSRKIKTDQFLDRWGVLCFFYSMEISAIGVAVTQIRKIDSAADLDSSQFLEIHIK